MANFDFIEYTKILNDFFSKMKTIKSYSQSQLNDALSNVCDFLRISKIEVYVYNNYLNSKQVFNFYQDDCNDFDTTRVYQMEKVLIENEYKLITKVYPKSDDCNWLKEEIEKIDLIIHILFMFCENITIQNMLEFIFYHDKDLKIYNLSYLEKVIGDKIAEGSIDNYGICYFNLKRFSIINKQLGRDNATQTMLKFIIQLQDNLSSEEIISRVVSDSFMILFHKENLNFITNYLNGTKIIYNDKLKEKINISAIAGYYIIQDLPTKPDIVIDRVSMAFRMARSKQKDVFYNETIMREMENAKIIENLFPSAIENEEFQVYYQPKVNLKDYTLVGAEALCRWYKDGVIVPPIKFIPVLEQNNNICTLDFYMLEHVCKDIRKWLDEGRKVVKISINLSRCHLGDTKLLKKILEIIDRYDVPHEYIEIELTETTTDVDFKDLKEVVIGLQRHGISASVDDFGIGYSSLNLIRELPWNVIKIDKSFLNQLENLDDKVSKKHFEMLKHIISMTNNLGMECIVEGVETIKHIKILKENHCYLAQGYYFDKPLMKNIFETKLLD